jgi:methylase of polypeptide subunit release factors
MNALPNTRRSIAVIGRSDGGLAISLATALPDAVVAGFDTDAQAVVTARRRAARHGVADRVTFEATPPGAVLGSGYHIVVLTSAERPR